MKQYIAIDLKSFYASVECVARGLDPLRTNLVVADKRRTEKTICLAVSPALKAYGIPGRPRLFEVVQQVEKINRARRQAAPGHVLTGSSFLDPEVRGDPSLALDYLVAPPRMSYYMRYSARIYAIYLKYVAPEDIHVYSIDEVFLDATDYLAAAGMNAHDFARTIMRDILAATGINPDTRVKDLDENDVSKLREYIDHNLRVEGELRGEVNLNIKRLMEIGCYRGIRHRKGLPVRGQSSKRNARTRKGPRRTVAKKKK